MRNLLSSMLLRFLSLAAGEADPAASGDGGTAPAEKGDKPIPADKTDVSDGGGFFDEEPEEKDENKEGKGRAGAKETTGDEDTDDDDDADEDDDDDGDDDDAESSDDGDESEGDGGEESVDSAAALSIRRGWETRFEAEKAKKGVDPLAGVMDSVQIPASVRERVKQKFEAEDDVGAIEEVVKAILPGVLGAYDERRVTPVLDAAEVSARNVRLVTAVQAFDAKHPGARTTAVSDRMATLYDGFKEKYGYKFADAVPVEDYFHMAGGRIVGAKKSKGTKTVEAEKDKQGAVQATRQPERVAAAAPAGAGKGGKAKGDPIVRDTMRHIQRTRLDPFVIR